MVWRVQTQVRNAVFWIDKVTRRKFEFAVKNFISKTIVRYV